MSHPKYTARTAQEFAKTAKRFSRTDYEFTGAWFTRGALRIRPMLEAGSIWALRDASTMREWPIGALVAS